MTTLRSNLNIKKLPMRYNKLGARNPLRRPNPPWMSLTCGVIGTPAIVIPCWQRSNPSSHPADCHAYALSLNLNARQVTPGYSSLS